MPTQATKVLLSVEGDFADQFGRSCHAPNIEREAVRIGPQLEITWGDVGVRSPAAPSLGLAAATPVLGRRRAGRAPGSGHPDAPEGRGAAPKPGLPGGVDPWAGRRLPARRGDGPATFATG